MILSYDAALEIATCFAEEVVRAYPGKIEAVFAIGSLGGDYYRPGQSDIDTAVITNAARRDLPPIAADIGRLADAYWKRHDIPKGFGAIVFAQEQLRPPYLRERGGICGAGPTA